MTRNLKAMGIAVVAVLVLSAVVASAASAQNGRITSTGNVSLTGTEIAGKTNAWTFGIKDTCQGTFIGHKYNVTPHTFMASGSETSTLTPTYKSCQSPFGPTTIDLNGCDYVIHIGGTSGPADTYAFTTDIVCPVGKDITMTNWFSTTEHTEGKEPCTWHIAPQVNITGGTIRDTTEGDLELGGVEKLNAVQTKDGLHALLCPAKEGTLEVDLAMTVKGDNEALTETDISLSHF